MGEVPVTPRVVLSANNVSLYHHAAVALHREGYLQRYFCALKGSNDFGLLNHLLPSDWQKRLKGKSIAGFNTLQVESIPWPYLLTQAFRRIHLINIEKANLYNNIWFDFFTQRRLPECDIFHFVNGIGLETLKRAKERECLSVCDVRAAHIDFEEEIMQKEFAKLSLAYHSTRKALRTRLLAEYALADVLIVNSAYVYQTFRDAGVSAQKIHVVPRGVDLQRFGTVAALKTKKQASVFRVLFVGRINPGKGVHYLIEAFAALNIPNSELVIVGKAEDDIYQTYLNKMIGSNNIMVKFMGHLPQIDLWEIYQRSDLFVLPTLSEGSALVVYEAMAAGLPIITTTNAGSIIENGTEGYIVPIRSSLALQEKMEYLYKHPDLRQTMGKQSRLRVQDFSWEKYGQRLLAVYGNIWSSQGTKQR